MVSKTANLFVEEFDLGPGDQVAIALPMHWRRVVFELALGLIGAEEAEDSTRLLVTAHPEAATAGDTADDTVVVELASPGPASQRTACCWRAGLQRRGGRLRRRLRPGLPPHREL